MTRTEAMRQTRMFDTLRELGFTQDEAEKLRRISMTLHRWHELECGTDDGCIERYETTGKPYMRRFHQRVGEWTETRWNIPDRETGAKKRLAKILAARSARDPRYAKQPFLSAYIQTDPRGAALYILRPGDVPEGKQADSYYSRGVCVY